MGTPVSRSIAGALGLFLALGWRGQARWVVDLPVAAVVGLALLALAYAATGRRSLGWGVVAGFGVAVGRDIVRVAGASFDAGTAIPFSAWLSIPIALVAFAPRVRRPRLAAAAVVVSLGVALPLALVVCFGTSNYTRHADRIVVFGARCYADGKPSLTLADRVDTACRLYHAGFADKILMSGGPGDGAIHETEAMARRARERGVPDHAIEIDAKGVDTWATVDATPPGRTLAVSHFYHLPRIELAFRARGREVYTVPAKETRAIRGTKRFVAREVPAFWWYWLRAVNPFA